MEQIYGITELLSAKKELFVRYEQLTEQMLTDSIEKLADLTMRRQKLCNSIDKIDKEIVKEADKLPNGSIIVKALHLQCLRDQVPDSWLDFFDKVQEIFAIVNRVRQMEPEITARIQNELMAVTEKIKENNRSMTAYAAKFGNGIYSEQDAGILGKKYQKV